MNTAKRLVLLALLSTSACNLAVMTSVSPASDPPEPLSTPSSLPSAETFTAPLATLTPPSTLTPTFTPFPTETQVPTPTPLPTVESLKARVVVDKLSCRYGPGALYLYLFALNGGANIKLIGRTDGNNWVLVENSPYQCWVNAKFLEIQGDPKSLPAVYPGFKLIVSPYYPGPSWANATRNGNSVEIWWEPVPISPGKFADENMQQYLVEVWRCENGEIIFETLGTNYPAIKVENDEPGCSRPSHGRVYLQEKHGYGGPVEIPWPPHD
ncbi:MAG: hypothetical protein HXY42_06280 [Chloroflexi bacterium]|nr:hypothetical protein [Chloroflexota bacterium]